MSRTVLGLLVCLLLMLAGCGVEWLPTEGNTLEPTPAAITFTPKLCQTAATLVESADVEVTSVSSQATVKIDIGEYSLDKGVTWFSTSSFVTPTADQKLTIRVRHTTATVPVNNTQSEIVFTKLTVGNTVGIFYSSINVGQTSCR